MNQTTKVTKQLNFCQRHAPPSLLRQALVPPNAVSLSSLALALLAMWKLPSATWPSWCVIGCIVLDVMDGRIARITGRVSVLGTQLDSLVDIVAFGALPALLVLHHAVGIAWPLQFAAALFFIVCAALRLAQFNSSASNRSQRFFTGLPSPVAAGLVALVILVLKRSDGAAHFTDQTSSIAICLTASLAAWLMVSELPFASFKTTNVAAARQRLWRRSSLVAAAVLGAIGLAVHPSLTLLLVLVFYVASGWLIRQKMNRFMERLAQAKVASANSAEKSR